MTVHVKWFATLVKRTKSKLPMTEVVWREGITPHAVFTAEGFNDADMEAVMVIVNDEQAKATATLKDGDRVEFMVSIQGG